MDDWYRVTLQDIQKNGGGGLLQNYYGDSPSKALQTVYHEHEWMLWRFDTVPLGYWEKLENQKEFFEWLQKELGYRNMNDWYKLSVGELNKNGGGTLLSHYYGGSLSKALQTVYPEHNWIQSSFHHLNWNLPSQRTFFELLGKQLGHKCLDDWLNITEAGIVIDNANGY